MKTIKKRVAGNNRNEKSIFLSSFYIYFIFIIIILIYIINK